jgi:hypothetical protein
MSGKTGCTGFTGLRQNRIILTILQSCFKSRCFRFPSSQSFAVTSRRDELVLFVLFAAAPCSPAFVPTGQSDNSPAFQRRVIVGTGTSPAGTAERTPQCSDHVPPFHPANLFRPAGTCIDFTTNPALKCRAIVIASLRDGQMPFAPIVHKWNRSINLPHVDRFLL